MDRLRRSDTPPLLAPGDPTDARRAYRGRYRPGYTTCHRLNSSNPATPIHRGGDSPMWRQGDVFIAPVRSVPASSKRRPGGVLVEGEVTGHSHRVADLHTAELLVAGDE